MSRASSELGPLVRVRQRHASLPPVDVRAAVTKELERLGVHSRIAPGQSVGLGVGSRGITDLLPVLHTVVAYLHDIDAKPFIIPAMGSHGGATADGQTAVLETLGVSEASIGIPIHAAMDTVELGSSALGGVALLTARTALDADHVLLINRVKPHTHFYGPVQSGLAKMLVIGLGKQPGAELHHRTETVHGWQEVTSVVVPELLAAVPVVGGLALVEGADGSTIRVAGVAADRFLEDEGALLEEADSAMHTLPFAEIDLLLVDRIGKNISGTGMDTSVIGRKIRRQPNDPEPTTEIRAIGVRGLTSETGGNALGIGYADFCRTRVLDQMDREMTRLNSLTASDLTAAMHPLDYSSDAELLDAALPMVGLRSPMDARVVWIRDTLHLDETLCAAAMIPEISRRSDLELIGDPTPVRFDSKGNVADDYV